MNEAGALVIGDISDEVRFMLVVILVAGHLRAAWSGIFAEGI